MALVCAHYARLLAGLWLEMPMEHICIVKWAHHRIVWPNQGFARKAVMCLLSLQEQGCTLTPGIQTIPSRLSCTSMFCLLWRLVKSGNLRVAMSLPVSTVYTSISARHLYTNISESVVAYALGLYTCYVQELVAEAATNFVHKALHLVLLKDDKGLLPLQLWDIQWENLAASLDQYLVLSDYLQG